MCPGVKQRLATAPGSMLRGGQHVLPLVWSRTLNSSKVLKWETGRKSLMSHSNHNCLGLLYYWVKVPVLKFSVVNTSLSLQPSKKWFRPWKMSMGRGLKGLTYLPWHLSPWPRTGIWQVKTQRDDGSDKVSGNIPVGPMTQDIYNPG